MVRLRKFFTTNSRDFVHRHKKSRELVVVYTLDDARGFVDPKPLREGAFYDLKL